MVSFDVVSLFTKVPLKETLQLLSARFNAKIVNLFQHVLTSTYFQFRGEFYEQTDGVAMGSPLSPAIANFFMEDFEERALSTAKIKPKYYFRYVDDTFIVWPHGQETLPAFLQHMNSLHPNIQVTMEMEKDGCLPFLDVLIRRKEDGSLSHRVYRKPTHTDLYLNGLSHHHPSQRNAVLTSLFHRAKRIADEESLPQEINHLRTTFQRNGYGKTEIMKALKRTFQDQRATKEFLAHEDNDKAKPIAKAALPYISTISGKLSRILRKRNIETIHKPPGKLRSQLVKVKDRMGLKTSGVYQIPWLRLSAGAFRTSSAFMRMLESRLCRAEETS
ncbi:uncharacterized protein LOC124153280 [Ischnura elegans]|uniref:uncharacterized protein LOC124153280 n=1 Tax=Ischnura elegans TaxID=197161 RepID=UPI001ED8AFF1|nr:uncharacterized protein LOC124153280 [Ischnura elegans]